MVRKNFFSLLVALIILYLSLADSQTFDNVPLLNIPFFDKIVHFGMYFGLMSVIIIENRKSFRSFGHLLFIAIIPVLYGFLLEILQWHLTVSRSGSIYDAASDLAGVVTSVLLWFWISTKFKEKS